FVTDANVRGMDLHLSTYDVPRSGSSHFDPKTGVLTIEFHYMDDEPYKEKKIEDRISLRYGKHSGKVLAILIPVAKGNIGEVRLRVTNALEKIDRVLGDQ